MSDRDLVLEYWGCEVDQNLIKIILINIPGQRYAFGTSYPGEVEGEEFFFCRGYQGGIVSPAHFSIWVNDLGQYWVQSDDLTKPSFYKTFLNGERVEAGEKRLLKIGDIITLGLPETEWPGNGPPPYPIYRVQARLTLTAGTSWSQTDENEREGGQEDDNDGASVSPLDIDLIVSKIVSYLPFEDLKNARLLSPKFAEEGSRVLEMRGKVSFIFGTDYGNPEVSGRVFRYLRELEGLSLKMQNLDVLVATSNEDEDGSLNPSLLQTSLTLSDGEPGEKMADDFWKLLSSENFLSVKCLTLNCWIERHEDFYFLHSILYTDLGEQLEELELRGNLNYLPDDLDLGLPLLRNLRKFSHDLRVKADLTQRWVGFLVPLLPVMELEHFSCSHEVKEPLLQELLKTDRPNLKGLAFKEGDYYDYDEASALPKPSLELLLQLQRPLESLNLHYHKNVSEPGESCTLLEQLLSKHSSSLRSLVLAISHDPYGSIVEVRFPPCFPNLEELEIGYRCGQVLNITWSGDRVSYEEHFPSLRKLTVKLPRYWDKIIDGDVYLGPLLNSFFPADPDDTLRCETVRDLRVPSVTESSQPRFTARIRRMFPNAVTVKFGREEGEYY